MKRTLAMILCLSLLCGCARPAWVPAWVPGGEKAEAPSEPQPTPEPTPAPQLTVWLGAQDAAVEQALTEYTAQRGITLQTVPTAGEAALWLTPDAPESGAADLTTNQYLAAAAEKAGFGPGCTALPAGTETYGWQVDPAMLQSLLGADGLADLQASTWDEFEEFAFDAAGWIDKPEETTVTLNGNDYTLPAEKDANTTLLRGVFAAEDGDCGAALLARALAAAGGTWDKSTLTGPLNSVYATLTLEEDMLVENGAAALAEGTALLYRGVPSAVAATDADFAARLATVPLKFSFEDSDLADDCTYQLDELLGWDQVQRSGWLAVNADASAEDAAQALGFVLWLSDAGNAAAAAGLEAPRLTEDRQSALNAAWTDTKTRSGYVAAVIKALESAAE